MLSFDELRTVNVARCETGFGHNLADWSVAEWTNAMAGEAGEACNIAKKLIRGRDGLPGNKADDTREVLRAKLARELADTVIYADLVAAREGIDLGAVIVEVFNAKSEELRASQRLGAPQPAAPAPAPAPKPERDERVAATLKTEDFRGDHSADVEVALGEVPLAATVETLLELAEHAGPRNKLTSTCSIVLRPIGAHRVLPSGEIDRPTVDDAEVPF